MPCRKDMRECFLWGRICLVGILGILFLGGFPLLGGATEGEVSPDTSPPPSQEILEAPKDRIAQIDEELLLLERDMEGALDEQEKELLNQKAQALRSLRSIIQRHRTLQEKHQVLMGQLQNAQNTASSLYVLEGEPPYSLWVYDKFLDDLELLNEQLLTLRVTQTAGEKEHDHPGHHEPLRSDSSGKTGPQKAPPGSVTGASITESEGFRKIPKALAAFRTVRKESTLSSDNAFSGIHVIFREDPFGSILGLLRFFAFFRFLGEDLQNLFLSCQLTLEMHIHLRKGNLHSLLPEKLRHSMPQLAPHGKPRGVLHVHPEVHVKVQGTIPKFLENHKGLKKIYP